MKKHRRESAGVSYFTGNCVAFPVKQKALREMLHSAKCTNVNPRCLRCGRLYATFGLSKHWKVIAVAIAVIILCNIIIILLSVSAASVYGSIRTVHPVETEEDILVGE